MRAYMCVLTSMYMEGLTYVVIELKKGGGYK